MIYCRRYLRQQVVAGVAREIGLVLHGGCQYIIVEQYVAQRTDHYLATDTDIARFHSLDHRTEKGD
jgi:hypothetical protein